MPWAVAGAVIGGAAAIYAGSESSRKAEGAAEKLAGAQDESLRYLQEVERMPRAYREGALEGIGSEYGLTVDQDGNVISDGTSIAERARTSPFYTGSVDAAESSIMRNAAATGGLRSGNTQDALARANHQLYQQSYQNQLSGLSGLVGLPSYASEISGTMTGIGQTQAQGMVASAQAQQQGIQGAANAIGQGVQAWGNRPQQQPPPNNAGWGVNTTGGYGDTYV